MATAAKTGLLHTFARARRAWSEMDHAQRRVFEIRTGIPVTRRGERVRPATSAEELDSLYEWDDDQLAA